MRQDGYGDTPALFSLLRNAYIRYDTQVSQLGVLSKLPWILGLARAKP